jgi:hypothetical protein
LAEASIMPLQPTARAARTTSSQPTTTSILSPTFSSTVMRYLRSPLLSFMARIVLHSSTRSSTTCQGMYWLVATGML